MTIHEQFADDLTLHALGALTGEPLVALQRHLENCPDCREELEWLHNDMAMLAMSAEGPVPPQSARERLLSAIAKEPRVATKPHPTVVPARVSLLTPIGWLAAAAVMIVAAALWQNNDDLQQQMAQLKASAEQQQRELAVLRMRSAEEQVQLRKVRETLALFTAPQAQHVTLVATQHKPQPQGKAIYLEQGGNLIFVASNLPPLDAGRTYELWLIPPEGAPLPAGVFTPDKQGNAVVMNPPLPAGTAAKLFAVTVEPEGGSAAPTTKPMLVGAAT